MPDNHLSHHRRSIRLKGYDYTQAGAYFVTLVTHRRLCLFGEVVKEEMKLNVCGEIARVCWREIPAHFPNVILDTFVIMPNHLHGIILICTEQHASPTPAQPRPCGPAPRSIATIVGSYKSAVTRRINGLPHAPASPLWQRNYYEHILRNQDEWASASAYIENNPAQWPTDPENPPGTPCPL